MIAALPSFSFEILEQNQNMYIPVQLCQVGFFSGKNPVRPSFRLLRDFLVLLQLRFRMATLVEGS